jgi:hypothetical protein
MTENYTTDDPLLKIERTDQYRVRLTFDVASAEGESLFADWRGHRLAITDALAVFTSFNQIQKQLREMRRNKEDVWESVLAIGRG